MKSFYTLVLIIFILISPQILFSQPIKVEIKKEKNKYVLYRSGTPYFIKGAGSFEYYDLLKAHGGNSVRLWNTDNAKYYLDKAQEQELTVTLGLFIGSQLNGFDYNNEDAVKNQFSYIKSEVLKYKDYPALLMWGIGNELNLNEKNKKVWKAINDIAKMIHEIDPNHPTVTTFAGVPKDLMPYIKKHCPDLDLIGINAFKDLPNIPYTLEEVSWNKPYIISEWGATGYWESDLTSWNAFIEENSTQKVLNCKRNYEYLLKRNKGLCLGSYVFIWGNKDEGTHTLFSFFLSSGSPTSMVDLMNYLWTGNWPENQAPVIKNLTLERKQAQHNIILQPGKLIKARVESSDPDKDELNIKWAFFKDSEIPLKPGEYIEHSFKSSGPDISFQAPKEGAYRLFVYVFDKDYKVATANIPFLIKSSIK